MPIACTKRISKIFELAGAAAPRFLSVSTRPNAFISYLTCAGAAALTRRRRSSLTRRPATTSAVPSPRGLLLTVGPSASSSPLSLPSASSTWRLLPAASTSPRPTPRSASSPRPPPRRRPRRCPPPRGLLLVLDVVHKPVGGAGMWVPSDDVGAGPTRGLAFCYFLLSFVIGETNFTACTKKNLVQAVELKDRLALSLLVQADHLNACTNRRFVHAH